MITLSRWVSLLLALGFVALIVGFPRSLVSSDGVIHHGWFVLSLVGMSISLVWGLGFEFKNRRWYAFFNPLLGWSLLCLGLYQIWL